MEKRKQEWVTEGDDISVDRIDSLLYRNKRVEQFLKDDSARIVVAGKGVGKTVLLKMKRKDLEERYNSSVLFIPSPDPYLDFVQAQLSFLSKNQMEFLQDRRKVKLFWQFSLMLSIMSYWSLNNGEIDFKYYNNIPSWIIDLVNSGIKKNPCDIFTELVSDSNISKKFEEIKGAYVSLGQAFTGNITSGVYVFIDRLDQAITETQRQFWIELQLGLLEAAWEFGRRKHIKVFCSIRQEAYSNYESADRNATSGNVTVIEYSDEDLAVMMDQSSDFYEGKELSEALGKSKFRHPKTGIYENVDSYIIRHTMRRPRDFVSIIKQLDRKGQFDTNKFRATVNRVASKDIARNLFEDDNVFLNCIKERSDREHFLSLIPHNVLNRELLLDVCCSFNGNGMNCSKSGCHYTETCKHPFSELFNLGLLGYIDKDDVQRKKKSKQTFNKLENITVSDKNLIPENSSYYLIHPCLNDYIKSLRPSQYMAEKSYIIPFITIKPDGEWSKDDVQAFKLFKMLESEFSPEFRDQVYEDLQQCSVKERKVRVLTKYNELTEKRSKKVNQTVLGRVIQKRSSPVERFDEIMEKNNNKK